MSRTVYYPLSNSFMAIGIILLFLSIWLISDWSASWGFTFTLMSILIIISSFVSMTKAEPIPSHMNELAIHAPERKKKVGVEEKNISLKMPEPKWYDAFFLAFILLTLYLLYNALTLSKAKVNPTWFIIILTFYIVLLIFLVVDALSNPDLSTPQQILFVLFILALGPIGMLAYYGFKRMTSSSKK